MSDSPISTHDLPEEPLLWFIDRVGNRQLIDTYTLNNVIYNVDNIIEDISPIAKSLPSEFVLDVNVQFSKEQ